MAELSAPKPGATVAIENYSVDGKSLGIVQMSRLAKTDAERRAQLSPLAFQVTRQAGTETPFSGQYAANHAAGLYRCICCDTTLFDSHTKFESGTS
jgi:peptide-methionine (R)-S-oxide reductase